MTILRGSEFCRYIHQYDVIMASHYVNMSIKLCLVVENHGYIYLFCVILVAVSLAVFKFERGVSKALPRSQEVKKPCLSGVKTAFASRDSPRM